MLETKALDRLIRAIEFQERAGQYGTFCHTEDLIQLIDELQLSRSQKVMTPEPERLGEYRLAIARNDGTIVDLVLNDLTYGDVKAHREIIARLCQCVTDVCADRIAERGRARRQETE